MQTVKNESLGDGKAGVSGETGICITHSTTEGVRSSAQQDAMAGWPRRAIAQSSTPPSRVAR
jgi:hypothetical protein